MSLKGKKVKIIVENYEKEKEMYNPLFLSFINENKDTIFTVKQEKKYKGTSIYTFKENDTFVFHESNLRRI